MIELKKRSEEEGRLRLETKVALLEIKRESLETLVRELIDRVHGLEKKLDETPDKEIRGIKCKRIGRAEENIPFTWCWNWEESRYGTCPQCLKINQKTKINTL